MITTDEELAKMMQDVKHVNFKQRFWPHTIVGHTHTVGNCCECIELLNDLATREDLIQDLIEARRQIKVLEGAQCAC